MIHHSPENFEAFCHEIAYAYENVPFFQNHMEKAGIRPLDIKSPEDIPSFPPTEKKHYRTNFPCGIMAKGYSLNDKIMIRMQSSGTAGERLLTFEVGILYLKRAMQSMRVNQDFMPGFITPKRRHCVYAAPNCSYVECANPNSTMADRMLPDGSLALPVLHDLLSTPEATLKQTIEEIEKFRPDLYYVDPFHFSFLARYMQSQSFKPPPAPILSTYSLCTQISRRQILELFQNDVPFAELSSMSELGFLAMECPNHRLHLNNASYFLELLTEGRPAESGETGELLVTTLDRGCSPHIRYRTGDLYSLLDEKCPCENDFPVVRIEGRSRNALWRNGKMILTPRALDDIIGPSSWMDLYKMQQLDNDSLVFTFIPNDNYAGNMEKSIIEKIDGAFGRDVDLRVQASGYIPSESSGKFVSCASAVAEKLVAEEATR